MVTRPVIQKQIPRSHNSPNRLGNWERNCDKFMDSLSQNCGFTAGLSHWFITKVAHFLFIWISIMKLFSNIVLVNINHFYKKANTEINNTNDFSISMTCNILVKDALTCSSSRTQSTNLRLDWHTRYSKIRRK